MSPEHQEWLDLSEPMRDLLMDMIDPPVSVRVRVGRLGTATALVKRGYARRLGPAIYEATPDGSRIAMAEVDRRRKAEP